MKLSSIFPSQLWPCSHRWYLCRLNLWSFTFPVWEEDSLVALESVYCGGESNHAESCIRPTILRYLQLYQPKPYCASLTAHIIWRVLSREGNYCSWAAGGHTGLECINHGIHGDGQKCIMARFHFLYLCQPYNVLPFIFQEKPSNIISLAHICKVIGQSYMAPSLAMEQLDPKPWPDEHCALKNKARWLSSDNSIINEVGPFVVLKLNLFKKSSFLLQSSLRPLSLFLGVMTTPLIELWLTKVVFKPVHFILCFLCVQEEDIFLELRILGFLRLFIYWAFSIFISILSHSNIHSIIFSLHYGDILMIV